MGKISYLIIENSFTQTHVFGPDSLVIEIWFVARANNRFFENGSIYLRYGRMLIEIIEELVDLESYLYTDQTNSIKEMPKLTFASWSFQNM